MKYERLKNGKSSLWHWLLRIFQPNRSSTLSSVVPLSFIYFVRSFIHLELKMCWLTVREEVKVVSGYFSFCKRTYYLLWSVSILLVYVIQIMLHSTLSHRLRCFYEIDSQVCGYHQKNRRNMSVSTWKFRNMPSTNAQSKENEGNCLAVLSCVSFRIKLSRLKSLRKNRS